MRENYYIFLDADAILFSSDNIKEQKENGNFDSRIDASKESVYAVKTLLESLNHAYDVTLIILSSWKVNMAKTYMALIEYGLTDVRKVEATKQSTHKIRGLEIKDYLKEKPNNDNYFILTNDQTDIKQFVNAGKIINTTPNNEALTVEQIEPFLKQMNVAIKYPKIEDHKLTQEEFLMEA